jgi:hypothetical protein
VHLYTFLKLPAGSPARDTHMHGCYMRHRAPNRTPLGTQDARSTSSAAAKFQPCWPGFQFTTQEFSSFPCPLGFIQLPTPPLKPFPLGVGTASGRPHALPTALTQSAKNSTSARLASHRAQTAPAASPAPHPATALPGLAEAVGHDVMVLCQKCW